jgi:diaminopimelate epimerase
MSLKLSFAKYHGAGNDFILIDDRGETFPVEDAPLIARLCQHRTGIGADGLILLQLSKKADFRMRIFNCDGREADMCGNGVRCLADFIRRLGVPKEELTIETGAQITRCHFVGDKVCVAMGAFRWIDREVQIGPYKVYAVDTGVPHAVIFGEAEGDFNTEARAIRSHPQFQPHGVNVNFARLENGKIRTRTYERGVEDETLACGTGAAAVGVVAQELHGLASVAILPASEEEMHVEIEEGKVTMTGPATFVFKGEIT